MGDDRKRGSYFTDRSTQIRRMSITALTKPQFRLTGSFVHSTKSFHRRISLET